MKRRVFLGLLVVVLLVSMTLLSSCEKKEVVKEKEEGLKYGGSLRIAMTADTNTLDPAITMGNPDTALTQACYDNLVMIMHDLSLKPMLATSWKHDADLTSWTFHLRKGVKFHHGKTFNADDVVFTFMRLLDPNTGSPARGALDAVDKIVKVDDYTVRFELKSPSAFLPNSLSIYQARIVPSDIEPARFATQEFGTGPFVNVEYSPGVRSVSKRNPDYWDESLPYLDELIFYYMTEPATRAEALKTGAVDVYYEIEPVSAASVEARPEISVSETASGTYINLAMMVMKPPFDNKLVRQAFQAAMNREEILKVATYGRGMIGNDIPIAPNDPHYDATQEITPYDVDRAKSLLAKAGYPNGIDVTLHTSSIMPGMDELAVAFKESASRAGIKVTIQRSPEDVYWSSVWMVEPFTVVSWNGRPVDEALSIVYLSDATWNETGIKNPTLDALIKRARGESELAQRKETYAEIQRILIDDASRLIPVFMPVLVANWDYVKGVSAHPLNWLFLHEAWIEK